MSETRATTPVFPPGRYGRRRDGRRRLLGPIVFGIVVIAISVALTVRLYHQYGDPTYDAQIVGWTGTTETQITINFTVRVPPGGSATCVLRARTFEGAEVGRRVVTIAATGDDTTIKASEPVTTTARASVGDVIKCARPA